MSMRQFLRVMRVALAGALVCAGSLLFCLGLSGCLVVSYSTESGWWMWPGSFVVTLGIALWWWLSRRH